MIDMSEEVVLGGEDVIRPAPLCHGVRPRAPVVVLVDVESARKLCVLVVLGSIDIGRHFDLKSPCLLPLYVQEFAHST